MRKNSGIVKQIKKFRKALGMNQVEFAKHVGFPQSRISELERGKAPSVEMLLRLGTIAAYPDRLWFWGRAGIDKELMLSVFAEFSRDIGQKPPVGKVIAVPPFQKDGPMWYVDGRSIPLGSLPAYYVLAGECIEDIFRLSNSGAMILLDTAANDAKTAKPFWDSLVLVEATEENRRNFPFPPRRGLHMGWLHLGTGEAEGVRYAVLDPTSQSTHDYTPYQPSDSIAFGRWTGAEIADEQRKRYFAAEGRKSEWEFFDAAAKEELRLFPGCTILGRVLGWFVPQRELNK